MGAVFSVAFLHCALSLLLVFLVIFSCFLFLTNRVSFVAIPFLFLFSFGVIFVANPFLLLFSFRVSFVAISFLLLFNFRVNFVAIPFLPECGLMPGGHLLEV